MAQVKTFGGQMHKCIMCTAQSGRESGSAGISNIRSAAFDFQQIGYTLQTKITINTQDRGSFMLVAITLCLKERSNSKYELQLYA